MAIPKAKFIGLSIDDPDGYGLPCNVGIKLNDKDISRAKELLKYRWFERKAWQEEIKRMLAGGLKYELKADCLQAFHVVSSEPDGSPLQRLGR